MSKLKLYRNGLKINSDTIKLTVSNTFELERRYCLWSLGLKLNLRSKLREGKAAVLQAFFGDDEHTSADGPYLRVMKARKWLYGATVVATAFNMHLLDLKALASLIKVIRIPEETFRYTLLFSILYLTIQYIILIVQVAVSYDVIISDRAKMRKDDDLRLAQRLVDESKKEVLAREQDVEANALSSGGVPSLARLSGDSSSAQAALDAAEKVYRRNVHELSSLVSRDPYNRRFYKAADYAIDVIRISTPLIIAIIAMIGLIAHW